MPTTLEFFKALFGGEEELETGYMLITNLKGANKFTKSLSEAVAYADELKETSDVYFGTGLYEKPRKKGHGDEIDILIRGFYCLDIDIGVGFCCRSHHRLRGRGRPGQHQGALVAAGNQRAEQERGDGGALDHADSVTVAFMAVAAPADTTTRCRRRP